MSLRYLFGPVGPAFVNQNLQRERQAGTCLAFDESGTSDLALGPRDTWESVCARLPDGWRPDCVVLYLAYSTVPAWLWSVPAGLVLHCIYNLDRLTRDDRGAGIACLAAHLCVEGCAIKNKKHVVAAAHK